MKKNKTILLCIGIGIILFLLAFNYNTKNYPNQYYMVYLDGVNLGMVKSEGELKSYIDEKTNHLINAKNVIKTYCSNTVSLNDMLADEEIKKMIDDSQDVQYYTNTEGKDCVDITLEDGETVENVYTPNGLEIEKVLTYDNNLSSVEDVYKKIVNQKSFTVKGYQFSIVDEDKISYIYVLDKNTVEEAINSLIETYVGKDQYTAYLKDNQLKIETVGSILENVYIQEDINVKEVQIPINEKIYTDSNELAQFLLYGDNPLTTTYTVKENEMIEDIALNNEISSQEFLISNPKYKDENSLITTGTEVQIKQTNPQLKVVVEKYVVEDKENEYKTIYEYDSTQNIGYTEVSQAGENGLDRISQRLKIINGVTVYIEPKGKEVLKASIDKVVIKGDKVVPNIGDLNNWAWPSESGWTITDNYQWRIHPITGVRQFHPAIDIAGTGYNSPIYAANNGTVIIKEYSYSYGNYIVINHNNGYYTLYAHMNKFYDGVDIGTTVYRGQQIGYVGSTGYSTGPHIHFEVWKGCEHCTISPWSIYK